MRWEQNPDVDDLNDDEATEDQNPSGSDDEMSARLVPAPSRPMAVARELVKVLFTRPDGLILRNHRGDFFRWDGTRWPEIDRRDVRAAAYQFLEHAKYVNPDDGQVKSFAPTQRKITDVLDALSAVVLAESAQDAPFWMAQVGGPSAQEIVSMRNGLLDVATRTLQPHSTLLFNYHALPFAFERQAAPPRRWLDFLAQLWDDDTATIGTLQEMFGHLLAGDTRQQKMFMLCGPKRGGKGTVGRVLTGLLGAHQVAAPTLASLSTNFGLQPLIGKPLALISDARLSTRADSQILTERLLSISGEDSLTIDRKYREPWTGRLPTRFLVMTNELPRLSDASGALASRFILLVLTRSFFGQENPNLTSELLTESPGIFNWALAGLDRLNARGYFVNPPSGADAVQQIEDLSSPISAFIRECCLVGTPHKVEVDALWARWKTWCEADNSHPGTKNIFYRNLRAAVPGLKHTRPRKDGSREHVYEGIGLCWEDYSAQ